MSVHDHATRWAGDLVAAGAIAGTFLQALPPIAAIVGIIWYLIMIWESKTVQDWRHKHRAKKAHRRVHRAAGKSPRECGPDVGSGL